jgi:hypothetical protein
MGEEFQLVLSFLYKFTDTENERFCRAISNTDVGEIVVKWKVQ